MHVSDYNYFGVLKLDGPKKRENMTSNLALTVLNSL